jgi:predicted dehydrogenase
MNKKNPPSSPCSTTRRAFLAGTSAAVVATMATATEIDQQSSPYRVAVIGHTGRGNYGHGLDRVWLDVPRTKIVGVADADADGGAAAAKRLGNPPSFRDYRRMLDQTRPDFVTIAPRWMDQHRDMVVAAAERGIRGIYLEKPMCRTLAEADEIIAVCARRGVKLAIAHQTRYSPKIAVIREIINNGRLGQILEVRTRGKDDHRGGGEDLWVLGTHVVDLMRLLGGDPVSCSGTVWKQGRPVRAVDVATGNEGIGPLAGDEVHATFRLKSGAMGTFDSVRNAKGDPSRFGLRIFGTKGVLELHNTGYLPDVRYLDDSSWSPGRTGKAWVSVSSTGIGAPEPLTDGGLHAGNVVAINDLIAAVEEDRQPISSMYDARAATEMIVAVFESQRLGRPVTFPLENRDNPLTMLQ